MPLHCPSLRPPRPALPPSPGGGRPQGKGPAAVAVRDMCIRMRRESPAATAGAGADGFAAGAAAGGGGGGLVSRAILIDREVDIVTPMMTQITFEGLIDEVTGIRNGAVPYVPRGRGVGGI